MTFAACIPIILQSEGGFVNDPRDPGGATNLGITKAALELYRGHPVSVDDVKHLTRAEAESIYLANYYNPAHCPDLPAGADLAVFDIAVNSGVGRAVRMLQQAAGVATDGHFGPQTLAAVRAMSAAGLIRNLHDTRERFYRSLPTFDRFGKGWLARNDRTRDLAMQMAGAS